MAKICSKSVGAFYQHYPHTAIVVTARAGDKTDAMTVAWHSALSYEPPLYGVSISPKRLTYQLILESKEFVVNFVPIDKAEIVAEVGTSSGREVDKFQKFDLATEESLKVRVPFLADAYVSYECKLIDRVTMGDHELFVGEIVAVHHLREALDNQGNIDLEKIKPTLYLGGHRYVTVANASVRELKEKVPVRE